MTASKRSTVRALLKRVNVETLRAHEKTAYNYLIDYLEIGFGTSLEADRLLGLCIEVLKGRKK